MISLPSDAGAEPETPLVIEFIPASAIGLGQPQGAAAGAPTSEPPPAEPSTVPTSELSESKPHSNPNPNPKPNPRPTSNPNPGSTHDPFGDPNAWGELVGGGDPWAAAVMRALRSMKVPAWAGKIAADSPFAFRLVVCKDGHVADVLRKQSTGNADLDATLEHEISRVVLPPVPASMAAKMPRSCATLSYQFTWSAAGVG